MLAGDARVLRALERLTRPIDEDVCVLRDGVLVAGCVCAPSHWRLRDKLGAPLSAIHEPVPRYADELAAKVDRFVERLPVGVVVGRRNWTIHEAAARYEPERPEPIGVEPPLQWLRSERQTLHRRPRGAVVFAIRTDMVQLRDVPVTVRRALAARLVAEPDDLRRYHVQDRAPGLIAYLQQ